MIYRTRTKTRETPPKGSFLRMTARYIGSCLCGALIEPGDTIQYDTLNHKTLCCDCGRKRSEAKASGVLLVEEPPECQQLIDSYRQLQARPSPVNDDIHSQMQSLVHRLVQEFSTNSEARQFIVSLADCSDNDPDFVAIRARYKGPCAHCETVINAGQLCLYDRNGRRLHCIACDCQNLHVRSESGDLEFSASPPLDSGAVGVSASSAFPSGDLEINALPQLPSAVSSPLL
jgi:hypothetical protein